DLDVADVSPQPSTKQLDEWFTAIAYPKVQENLKLSVKEQVLLEEPASSSGTLSSLQHLSRDFSFGDQFFSDNPLDADKNAETKVESMVNVTIQQAWSSVSLMTSPIIDLTLRPESPREHQQLKATTTNITTTTTTTTTFPPPQAPQQSTTEAMLVKRIDIPQQVSITVSEVVTDAVDWAMQAPLRNRFRDLPKADMKEILHQRMWEADSYKSHDDHMQLFEALEKLMNCDHSEELVQDLDEARKKKKKSRESPKTPPVLSDVPVPTNNWALALASNYSPPPEDSLLAQTDEMATFIDWFCKRNNVSKPLPLGGPPGQVTIQSDFFFNKYLDYLRYSNKGSRPALFISKMKGEDYPDAGLEKMVPGQFWINEECKYDIAAIAVRTHMQILSEVQIEVFSMYGYDYMKKIVLRRVDLNKHVIVERDFKYLYPSDFEDLYLLNLQGHLNHLPSKDKKILTTAVNQWTRQLVIRQRVKDFQLGIESYQT
nr:hypothetical protein [Tanacetum cinerariifolium]